MLHSSDGYIPEIGNLIEVAMDSVNNLKEKIAELKERLRAVIVAHNYQRPEIQDIADFTGDSLELARRCTGVDAP